MEKRDIRINKGVSLLASQWESLNSIAKRHGLSRNGLLAAIAESRFILSLPPEAGSSESIPDPTPEYLLSLSVGSLPQNLQRALRIWAIQRTLPKLNLPKKFTLAQWRKQFFTASHPTNDQIPELHDKRCRCALTLAQWLRQEGVDEKQWRQSMQKFATTEALDEMLDTRLFAVTRRSLAKDLKAHFEQL